VLIDGDVVEGEVEWDVVLGEPDDVPAEPELAPPELPPLEPPLDPPPDDCANTTMGALTIAAASSERATR
jgi:hypothetical protein